MNDHGRIHQGKQLALVFQGLVHHSMDHPQEVFGRHKVIEVAHREQALGESAGFAHVCLACPVGGVSSIDVTGLAKLVGRGQFFRSQHIGEQIFHFTFKCT